jgi:copper transport protein
MNARARTAALLALGTVLAVAPAGPAFGHAELMKSTPRVSQALHRVPRVVQLRFDEPVSVPHDAVQALAADGRDMVVALSSGTTALVQARLKPRLPAGKYTVRWHVVADDGHVIRGSYRFKVRHGAMASSGAPMSATPPAAPNGTGRATTTILLVAALGALALALLSLAAIRRHGAVASPAKKVVAVDVGLIAVAGFCALALIGVIAANQAGDETAGKQQVTAAHGR